MSNTGLIPANYVKTYEEGDEISLRNPSSSSSGTGGKRFSANSVGVVNEQMNGTMARMERQPKLQPTCWVRVLADRWPSIYDVAALNIRVKFVKLFKLELLNCSKANSFGSTRFWRMGCAEA